MVLLHRPIRLQSAGLAGRRKRNVRLHAVAQRSFCSAGFEPLIEIGGGLHLLAVDFVGRLQQGVPQSEVDGQVGPDAPGVLRVILELVVLEIAIDHRARRQQGSGLPIGRDPIVGLRGHIVEQAGQVGHRVVVGAGKSVIDRRKSKHRGIETSADAYDAGIHQRIRIRDGRIVGQGIALVLVVNQPVVGAKLNGVASVGPGQIVNQVLYRHIDDGGSRLGLDRAHAVEIRVRALADSVAGIALANIAVAQAVHQVGEIVEFSPTASPLLSPELVELAGWPGNCGTPKELSFCRLPRTNSQFRLDSA